MVDETTSDESMTRAELANYLHELAEAFDGEGEMTVPVGNKTVTLTPTEEVNTDIEVAERSAMLGGDKESITLDLNWDAE
jgi:amphi-Trp domain-containing protein